MAYEDVGLYILVSLRTLRTEFQKFLLKICLKSLKYRISAFTLIRRLYDIRYNPLSNLKNQLGVEFWLLSHVIRTPA